MVGGGHSSVSGVQATAYAGRGRRSIAFYCGANGEPWGPDSLFKGIGGSEEAVILLSRQFAELGWDTFVFATPPAGRAQNYAGVWWIPYQQFHEFEPSQVFVAWRSADHAAFAAGSAVVCHWVHDRFDWGYPLEALDSFDRVLMVSEHQATSEGLCGVPMQKRYVSLNGLDEEFLRPPGNNQATRVIYASCPARGLETLLQLWPSVRARIPHAQLDVYHGFTAAYADATRMWPGLETIKIRVLRLLDRMASHGVTCHGMVGQDQLAEGFARAGVWAYPTHCRETSCITAMKALAMGCLPVTTGMGALRETLGPWDLGPPVTSKIHRSWWQRRLYLRRLLRAMQPEAALSVAERRLAGAAWARERYSWRRIASEWVREFAAIAAQKPPQKVVTPGMHPSFHRLRAGEWRGGTD